LQTTFEEKYVLLGFGVFLDLKQKGKVLCIVFILGCLNFDCKRKCLIFCEKLKEGFHYEVLKQADTEKATFLGRGKDSGYFS
jgi:hypothetical protein